MNQILYRRLRNLAYKSRKAKELFTSLAVMMDHTTQCPLLKKRKAFFKNIEEQVTKYISSHIDSQSSLYVLRKNLGNWYNDVHLEQRRGCSQLYEEVAEGDKSVLYDLRLIKEDSDAPDPLRVLIKRYMADLSSNTKLLREETELSLSSINL